ncbi:MAG: hypothetical protein KF912_06395 [Phycisphaeraceae bacterium]|nr:hypothetical protein [Phycisphaeraceae bacterium]MBX3366929.1 hypothetical protein [Phycisphaeraceae bacterium]
MIATSDQHPDPRVVAECIPAELKTMPRWACWKAVSNREGGKPKKVPIDPHTGGAAKSSDPATWGTFDEAIASLARDPSLSGVMFALGEDIGIVGVDLDGCIDADGIMTPEARALVEEFDTYSERSPSGSGVKLLCYGKKPGDRCRRKSIHGCHEIEVYSEVRFFVITGLRLDCVSPEVNQRQIELDDLYATMFPPKPEPPSTNPGGGFSGDDNALLQKARDAANGGKFTRLYDAGDISEYGGDDSAADLALVSMLAFWAGPDPDRIDRLFRGSALMRDKWDRDDYRRLTIDKALEGMTEFYSPRQIHLRDDGTELPKIVLDVDEHRVIREVIDALAADPDLYQRGGQLARVIWIADSNSPRPVIRPVEPPTLREAVTRNCMVGAWKKKGRGRVFIACHPPAWTIAGIHARGNWPGIRTLSGIRRAPVLRPDGSIHQTPGWDDTTGVLYLPGEQFPPIAADIGIDDAAGSIEALIELVSEFPFASAAHRSAFIAALLTMVARHAFTGNTPLFLVDANTRGAGKTLLAQVAGHIALGYDLPVATYAHDPTEMRKVITTMTLAAEPVVLLDNLSGVVGNEALDRALTGGRWWDRMLGVNKQVDLPMTTTLIATGNNISIAADTARRTIHIRLETNLERPEDRSGFRRADLMGYVRTHRAALYIHALTIVAAYLRAGSPDVGLRPMGSFEGWSRVIRGAIVWLGYPDPFDTREDLELVADTGKESVAMLLEALALYDPDDRGIVVAEMLASVYAGGLAPAGHDAAVVALRTAIENLCPSGGKPPVARQVSAKLKAYRRRVVNGQMLDFDPSKKRSSGHVWHVVKAIRRDGV